MWHRGGVENIEGGHECSEEILTWRREEGEEYQQGPFSRRSSVERRGVQAMA